MDEGFEAAMELLDKAESVWCPYCLAKQSDEVMYNHVTYWGEPDKLEDRLQDCEECNKEFEVVEIVQRTFQSKQLEDK